MRRVIVLFLAVVALLAFSAGKQPNIMCPPAQEVSQSWLAERPELTCEDLYRILAEGE